MNNLTEDQLKLYLGIHFISSNSNDVVPLKWVFKWTPTVHLIHWPSDRDVKEAAQERWPPESIMKSSSSVIQVSQMSDIVCVVVICFTSVYYALFKCVKNE